jgi:hypothetical protein
MSGYLGDFAPGVTVRDMWNSSDSNGASITRSTNGTISVYKDGGTTQSTTGLTDTEDFDSLTGVHLVAIDTSADGTFYSAGSDFIVVLSAATIDTRTVNATLFSFSLNNRTPLRPTTAGRTLDVSAGGEAGVDWANVGSPTTTVGLSGTTVKTATDVETDTQDIQGRLPAALTAGGNMKADALALSGDTTAADNAESFFDGTGYAGTNNVIPTVTTLTGHTAQTGDAYAIVNNGTHGNAAIKSYVDDIGAAGAGLSAIPWNAAWDAEVQSECADALNAYDPPTNTEMEARTIAAASYATATALDTVDNFLDTEIAAIKAKTDLIPGTTDGLTLAEKLTLFAAVLLGKASGLDTTAAVYRAVDDSKDRVTATVDESGNRSALTLDPA